MTQQENPSRLYEQIYALVRQVPPGKVVSYGQISRMVGGCSARQVGYAMAGLKDGTDVPWQRVINSQGRLSLHGFGGAMQRKLLEEEGIVFTEGGSIDFDRFGWLPLFPPSQE
jgi:methylated-DNA-protein-cysteine methyltransferase related protein